MEDAIVVGAGLTGAVVARQLADAGMRVQVIERRSHIAGNLYDRVDQHGFLVQEYGPHTFHTDDEGVFSYISRFGAWEDFRLTCGAQLQRVCSPTPFNFRTIDLCYPQDQAADLKARLADAYPGRATVGILELLDSPDGAIRGFADLLFREDYAPYTAKQWGIGPDRIDPSVLARVPVRLSYEEGYFDDAHQVLPADSYTAFVARLLDHPGISVQVCADALDRIGIDGDRVLFDGAPFDGVVVYTGAIDELFGYAFGRLPYRSLRFEWGYSEQERLQPYPIVAYPHEPGFTRITEYKQLPPQAGIGTSYAMEFPVPSCAAEGAEPFYPVLTQESAQQYQQYRRRAQDVAGLVCCGRLADFAYYNMDQAVRRALDVSAALLEGQAPSQA